MVQFSLAIFHWLIYLFGILIPFQDASQILYSLATMQHQGLPPAAMQQLLKVVLRAADACKPQALSNSVWAASQLGYSPPFAWSHNFCAALRPKLGGLKAQELSNVLVSSDGFGASYRAGALTGIDVDFNRCFIVSAAIFPTACSRESW